MLRLWLLLSLATLLAGLLLAPAPVRAGAGADHARLVVGDGRAAQVVACGWCGQD